MDPRITPNNGRVAHSSLQGKVVAKHFQDGTLAYVSHPVTDLCDRPNGSRQRQVLFGAGFVCLDYDDGWIYGYAQADGYCGWISPAHLLGKEAPTHAFTSRSYAKTTAGLKDMGSATPLSVGAKVAVLGEQDGWAEVIWSRTDKLVTRWVPVQHVTPLDQISPDAAKHAEALLGAPYLWGGNSVLGIDCSGLVQVALHLASIDCPGDSDLQKEALPPIDGDLQRGDLVFWKGHVGMLLDANTLIHANAHHMSVVIEPLAGAIERIGQIEFGDVTGYARPER